MDTLRKAILICAAASVFAAPVQAASLPEINGFGEVAYGLKISDDHTKYDSFNLLEERFQLKTTYFAEGDNYFADKSTSLHFKGDFTLDQYFGWETDLDLRALTFSISPFSFADLKAGRQVLTWGTGDYLFVNDLFPKDYISFFTGRDDEYLKKPSDAVKVSLYPGFISLDLVASFFEPNTQPAGDRLSFFDLFQGGIAARNSDRHLVEPAREFENIEYAARAYRSIGSAEIAGYYFRGFDKNAVSVENPLLRRLFYRRLDVYGASVRGPFLTGIANLEYAFYNSRDDSSGTSRLVENSASKLLAGYEKDLGNDLRLGLQYLYEQRLDYDDYEAALIPGDLKLDRFRHLITQRLTKQLLSQTLTLSVFNFYSPSDQDGYVRPSVSYDITDAWKAVVGANLPWGSKDYTEFSQMRRNKNIYFRVRYSF